MNPMEKQMQLGRELLELNTQWMGKMAEYDGETFKKYIEMNQSFAQRLPQISDISSFIELQREYGETLWNGVQSTFSERNGLVREAFEANTQLVREAWTPAAEKPAPAKARKSEAKAA